MKYMLLIYLDKDAPGPDEREECYAQSGQVLDDLKAEGKYISAAPLYPALTATCVQVRKGSNLVTDGPFAETREQLGGYYLIDAVDLDDAINIASRTPGALSGTVEIRQVVEPPVPDAVLSR